MTWPASHQFAGGVLFVAGQLLWTQRLEDLSPWHWLRALFVVVVAALFAWSSDPRPPFDLSSGVLFVALLWGAVGSWALRREARSRGLLLCGCGLLAWTAGASHVWELWVALLALGYLRITDQRERAVAARQTPRSAAEVLSLILASIGFVLLLRPPAPVLMGIPCQTISLVLFLTGAGWLMRTFPFPQLPHSNEDSPWHDVGSHALPVLLAPVLWMNLLPHVLVNERQLAILMPSVILPLLLAGLRAEHRPRAETTMRIIPYIASFAGMAAVILAGWDLLHPDQTLAEANPLLTGRALLPYILLADSVGWMLLATGLCHSGPHPGRFRTGCLVFGALSIAGLPPFPGYWWRLQLFSGLVIPHSRAPLLGLYEVTPGNVVFSGLLMVGLLLCMRPVLRLWPRAASVAGNLKSTGDNHASPSTAVVAGSL